MDNDLDFKQIAFEMGQRVGTVEAHNMLTAQKVSPSTATKLLSGKYPSEVGPLVGAAIVRADRASKRRAS